MNRTAGNDKNFIISVWIFFSVISCGSTAAGAPVIISEIALSANPAAGMISVLIFIAVIMFLVSICMNYKMRILRSGLKKTISKLEAAESKNRAMMTASPDPLFVFDSEGNFVDYYAESEKHLFAPPSEFMGKNIMDVLPPEIAELTKNMIDTARKTGLMQSYEYDIEIEGEKRTFNSRLVMYGDDRFLVIARNISEKKKRTEVAIRSHKLESLEIFAGGIANDFNNILSAIAGNISLARLRIDNREKTAALLDEAERAVLRAEHLSGQLLAFSKGGTPVKQITDLKELVRESADFVMSGSKSAINYDFGRNVFRCDLDRGQIGQVIQNIVLNSLQAMPLGGFITITLRNEHLYETNTLSLTEGDYAAISIKDEGSGIESKNLNRIFDPYFTTKSDGNGLGLTICSSIVKRHGGAIEVSSAAGKGSTFTIFLPAAEDAVTEKKIMFSSGGAGDLKNRSIMILDDEVQLIFIMKEVLKDEGAEVFTVSDGEEAIDLFEKMAASGKPLSLIIADLTIPGGMGGMEAIRIMREQGIPFKAIVISGYSNDPVISEFRSYGFDAFLTKPFTSDDLLYTVKKIFEK